MNKEILVSVYITNHNYAMYLDKAIQSVLKQRFNSFELIIIDDGSTDDSKQIIERYRNYPKVRIVYQENKGLNVSNNIAMRLAVGRYIMRLDADDYLDENALLIMANKLNEDKNIGLVFPDYYLVDQFDNVIGIERRHDFNKGVALKDVPAHGACTMIRKQILYDLGGYSEEIDCQDGYELWLKFVERYKIANINLPLFYYRQHPKNLTKNEKQLLMTRHHIVKKRTRNLNISLKNHIAIIPIRGMEENTPLALKKFGGVPLVDIILNNASRSENLKKIFISTPDARIIDHLKRTVGFGKSSCKKRIIVDTRPVKLAHLNVRIEQTLDYILEKYRTQTGEIDTISVLNIEYPFRSGMYIDKAINTLYLFEADSLISVRPENSVFYKHDGSGLKPINRNKILRLERDIVYRETGGIHTVRFSFYKKNIVLIGGKVSHIIIDDLSSRSIAAELDWKALESVSPIK